MISIPRAFRHIDGCKRCGLCKGRRTVVIGRGELTAKYMLIGEAPGEQEDKKGMPFVGKAGDKLDELMSAAGFNLYKDFYITNTVKCRPPNNRQPTGDEIRACQQHLTLQINTVRPQAIVVVGTAALTVFCPGKKIMTSHGKVFRTKDGVAVFPIIHPAATFRNPEWGELILEDLRKFKALRLGETKQTAVFGSRVMDQE